MFYYMFVADLLQIPVSPDPRLERANTLRLERGEHINVFANKKAKTEHTLLQISTRKESAPIHKQTQRQQR